MKLKSDFNEYQEQCHTTAIYPDSMALPYLAMGLVGEAGEVANKVKKVLRDDGGVLSPEKARELVSEIGDVLWYCAELSMVLGYSLQEVADMNLAKLQSRAASGKLKGQGDER